VSEQICEGIWQSRCGQRVVVTQCEPVDGQRWTNGVDHYSDDGSFWGSGRESPHDLVSFIGLLPDQSQQDQTAKVELLRTTLTQQTAEIDRLRIELRESNAHYDRMRLEFTAAQQLRSEVDRLQAEVERLQAELKGYAADSHRQLRNLQESHNKVTANLQAEQRGEREGFRIAISMILEAVK